METRPKPFRDQYLKCEDQGMHKLGEVKKFQDHPELLPMPFHKAARAIAEALEKDPDYGLTPVMCLRFGGECSSGHPECRKMRGLIIGN